jgi:beta-lactamase regulating signal transducer with metallopeptidase domain/ketosteroid isomerase-like protein
MNLSIGSLLGLADQAGLELLVWSWQALVLMACVWGGMKLFRVKTPALRQQIWLISLLVVLTLPVWPPLLPRSASPQPWNGTALSYAAELPRLVIVPAAEAGLPVTDYNANSAAPKRDWLSKILPGAFCLWVVGALIALLGSVRGYRRLRRAIRLSRPTTPEEMGSAVELPRSVSLSLSADVRSPVLVGIWHPVILLPHDIAEWTSVEEREAMIAHELAHVARLDHFTNLLPTALNVIFFFHPLVRYGCRQFCWEREMACDDRVVDDGADAAIYAESLVKAAERSVRGKFDDLTSYSLRQPAFFTSKQALERRIEMVLKTERVRVLARGWRYLILPAVLIVMLAGLLVPGSPTTAQQLQKQLHDRAASLQNALEDARGEANARQRQASGKDRKDDDPPPPLPQSPVATGVPGGVSGGVPGGVSSGVPGGVPAGVPPPKTSPQSLNGAGIVGKILQEDLNDRNIVLAILRESNDAMIQRDIPFFERVLADDYQAIDNNGQVSSKGEDIAGLKHLKLKITKIDIDDLRLNGEGNSMIATFLHTFYYEDDGQEKNVQFRTTVNFLKRQSGWQIVGWHQSLKH